MASRKSAKKSPTKKEIEEAAASVEEAIAKLEVEEVEVEEKVPVGDETSQESMKVEESSDGEATDEPQTSEEETEEIQSDSKDEKTEDISEPGTAFSKTSFEEEKSEGSSKSKLIITICLIIIFTIFGFIGGYFYGKSRVNVEDSLPSKTNAVPTYTPTPTEEEVDLSAYSIEILNGSGVAGVAGDEQSALEEDGFSVENTGNAENQDFTETVISAKESVSEEFIKLLRNSLEERYVVAEDIEELADDNSYDVVVTIGSEEVVDE